MNTEFEATFTDINKDNLRKKLKEIGADLVTKERLMQRWSFDFEHPDDGFDRWARVRDEGDKIVMTVKEHNPGSEENISHQKESEVEVDDFGKAVSILETVGCWKRMYKEQKREEWQKDNVEIVIDTWPHLEPLVEIEGPSEKSVKDIAQALGFDWENAVFAGTGRVYENKYGVFPDDIEDLRRLTFSSENPFV